MTVIAPREELRPYVRYYWTLKSNDCQSVLTFPLGCTQIIFHRGTPLFIPELGKSQDPFTVSGQVNFPAHVVAGKGLDMIVAVFQPHTIGMFIDAPPSEFYNSEISGYDLENHALNDLASMVFDCRNYSDCIGVLEEYLLSKVRKNLNISRIEASLNILLQNPSTTVRLLADRACLCGRQFERVFLESVGMSPKEYAGIVRFQKALLILQNGVKNYAGVATLCGYSDQSHFIREFRRYSGLTPRLLCQNHQPYSDLFSNPV